MKRTTSLDDLIREARRLTGIEETAAVSESTARVAAHRLAMLGATMPNFSAGRRRRVVRKLKPQ